MIAEWVGGGAPVDHEAEALKMEARDVASFGTERFRQYWGGLDKRKRASLSPIIPELQSIARDADALAPDPELVDDGPVDDPLADDFVPGQAAAE